MHTPSWTKKMRLGGQLDPPRWASRIQKTTPDDAQKTSPKGTVAARMCSSAPKGLQDVEKL